MHQRQDRPPVAGKSGEPGAGCSMVFFDGACPLCRREIAHYRRRRGAEGLVWIDIAQEDARLADFGLVRATAMARFHVLDRNGQWQTGAWGFAELWSRLPAYRWLARLLRGLRLLPLLDCAYTAFARWRLQRRCGTGTYDSQGH